MACLLRSFRTPLRRPLRAAIAPARTQSHDQASAGNVTGLSQKVVSVPAGEVGPGAAKDSGYKNPEYFCYNSVSYFEAEVEMAKYRLPQPSSKAAEVYKQ